MANTLSSAVDSYELIENEKNEIMILLYAGQTEPSNSTYKINEYARQIVIKRNSKDTLYIEDIAPEYMEKIKKLETLYVCELKYNENLKEDDETDILYAYASALEKNTSKQQKEAPKEDQTAETIQEKVKKTREKILEQREGKK